jgi:hypothetical protein
MMVAYHWWVDDFIISQFELAVMTTHMCLRHMRSAVTRDASQITSAYLSHEASDPPIADILTLDIDGANESC